MADARAVERRSRRAARPLAAALAALALAGCSATHVGDDWQCPLAQGEVCASVAAADPAVPATREQNGFAAEIPRHREGGGRIAPGAWPVTAGEPACESDCDPFAWLGSLFAGPADPGPGEVERADVARDADTDTDTTETTASPRNGDDAANAAAGDDAPSPPPDEAAGDADSDAASDPAAASALRTGEVVARIWIAPFVDADGIYREGAWVRAVIAPAGWRLR